MALVRANQSYDPSILADVPADKVVSIQINDVLARPYAAAILRDESMHDRVAPARDMATRQVLSR